MHAAAAPSFAPSDLAPRSSAGELVKPFAILAAIAFVLGFMGYLTVSGNSLEGLQASLQPAPMTAVAEAPAAASDASEQAPIDWNVAKKI